MRSVLTAIALSAVIVAWATPGWAQRQAVVLPYTFGPNPADVTGQANGVDTSNLGLGVPKTLTVNPGININTTGNAGGAVTTDTPGIANIIFLGSSTLTGSTGTLLLPFLNISGGVAGTTVTFNGPVFTTTFNVVGTGTLNFNGNVTPGAGIFNADGFINLGPGSVLAGAITATTGNTGTLTINAGSNVTGAVGTIPLPVKQINFVGGNGSVTGAASAQGISVTGGNASFGGAVQTSGFVLGANTLNITGALTTNAGGTVATTLAGNAVFGHVNVLGASLINAGGITVTPTVTGALTVGTTFRVIDGQAAGTFNAPVFVVNNNPRYTFIGVPTNVQGDVAIVLQAVAPLGAGPGAPPAAANIGVALGPPAAPGSDLAAVQDALAVLSVAGIGPALTQISPGVTNLAAPWVAGQVTRQFEDLWMARMDEIQDLCCDTCEPNRPANAHKCKGSENRGNWWAKGFGREGRQGDVDFVSGYKTRAYGAMLAYDTPLNDRTRAGVGIGYARNTIDGNNATGRTEIDSYQATAYLGYAPGPWFLQGALIAGLDRYDGTRPIVFTGVNRTAAADFTGHQYTGLVTAGTHLYNNQGFTVTPLASLRYSRIKVGSYAETGAGALNLSVASQDYDFVQSTVGVKAERVMRSGGSTYSPEAHFKWMHDFSSTTMQQTAAFAGANGFFTTQGIQQDREMFNLGAGFTVLSCACEKTTWTVKGLYDYKWTQSHYSSHQVSLILSAKF